MVTIRRLGPGDEEILAMLATDEPEFAEALGTSARRAVTGTDAADYLADPDVLHWVAEARGEVAGHLLAHVQRRRAGEPRQVLVYEVGVRRARRRKGIGRALMAELDGWMAREGVSTAWLLAEPDAVAFYEACGFAIAPGQSTLMRRRAT